MPRETIRSGSAEGLTTTRRCSVPRASSRVMGFVLASSEILAKVSREATGLPFGEDDAVAGAQAGRGGGRSRQDAADEGLGAEGDSGASDGAELALLPFRGEHGRCGWCRCGRTGSRWAFRHSSK